MKYKNLIKCVCCGSEYVEHRLNLDSMPLAGHFPKTLEEAKTAQSYPFNFLQCSKCWTVFCQESLSVEDLFSDYSYSSSTIPALVKHFTGFKDELVKRYGDKRLVFAEVGSNDNPLLNQLPNEWYKIAIDPSNVAANAFNTSKPFNSTLLNRPLTTKLIKAASLEGEVDVFTGSNCLAHFEGLEDAYRAIHLALRDGGDFWIEVKDLDEALSVSRYTDFYIEHLVAHSIHSLKNCLGLIGFNYIEHQVLPFHGGLIRALFRKEKPTQGITRANYKTKFLSLQTLYNNRYNNFLIQQLLKSDNNIAFGASGEANTFFNHFKDIKFKYVVDESPLRCGKFIPGVAIPIIGKDKLLNETEDCNCLVTAWTYFDNIVKQNSQFKGGWSRYFPIK